MIVNGGEMDTRKLMQLTWVEMDALFRHVCLRVCTIGGVYVDDVAEDDPEFLDTTSYANLCRWINWGREDDLGNSR